MRLAFFGSGAFAVPILTELAASRFRPELIVTMPDARAGRGEELRSPPLKATAVTLGLPVIQPEALLPVPPELSEPSWDLFVVTAYGKILPRLLLNIPRHGSLNVHPSLLPRWRGPAPIQSTILEGDRETGVTVILMDEAVDHGPILKSSKLEIRNLKVTAPELTGVLAKLGAKVLLETIPLWTESRITPRVQDEREVTWSRRVTKEDGHIDWRKPSLVIDRMVRAFSPWPGMFTFWQRREEQVRLLIEEVSLAGVLVDADDATSPGTVREYDGHLFVVTGDGEVEILRLKPASGHSVSGEEFLRGHRDIVGATLN